jgi:hypothetical protein
MSLVAQYHASSKCVSSILKIRHDVAPETQNVVSLQGGIGESQKAREKLDGCLSTRLLGVLTLPSCWFSIWLSYMYIIQYRW